MVIVYVLESLSDGIWYIGITERLDSRLKDHNMGKSKFTSGHRPWKIIYFESAPDWPNARAKEKYFKNAAGKKYIKRQLIKGSLPD